MENGIIEEMAANILKHSLRNKSLHPPLISVYDFEIMVIKTDNQSELE